MAVTTKQLPLHHGDADLVAALVGDYSLATIASALRDHGWLDGAEVPWGRDASAPHLPDGLQGRRMHLGHPPGHVAGSSIQLPLALAWPAFGETEPDDDIDVLDGDYPGLWQRSEAPDRSEFQAVYDAAVALLAARLGPPDLVWIDADEPDAARLTAWHRDSTSAYVELTDDINSYSHYDVVLMGVQSPPITEDQLG